MNYYSGAVAPVTPTQRHHDEPARSPLEASEPTIGVSPPNETAKWLEEHLTPPRGRLESDLYKMMRSALCMRLPVSARHHMIEDHIQNYMVRAIRRNALRHLLADGGHVPYSKVVAYVVNSGRTDARDMGTDPVCREMYGARTEKERKMVDRSAHQASLISLKGGNVYDTDGGIKAGPVIEIEDTALDFEAVWAQVQKVVRDRKPQAWERYSNILTLRAQGYSTREIGKAHGVSRNRAATMLADARRCVRDGYDAGQLDGFIQIDLM